MKHLTREDIDEDLLSPLSSRPSLHADFRSFFDREDLSQLALSVNDSAANKTFHECYDKEDKLGEGGFAVVYRCRHKLRGNIYAVKEIENEEYEGSGDGNTIKEEINAMKRLREIPYIVRLLDVFKEYDRTFMIMEEMKGGDLLDKIEEKEFYPEDECRKLSRRLFEAIYFCHRKRIVHRDIKPENLLLESTTDDTKIRLADFGCAKQMNSDTILTTMCGTPQYVAPEVYMQRNGYDEKCDLWSAAVVIYLLLGGYVPFDGDAMELPSIVCAGKFQFHDKYWKDISAAPKKLIKDLLRVDPMERATITEVLDTGWLRRQDKEKADLRRHSESIETAHLYNAATDAKSGDESSVNSVKNIHWSRHRSIV
jgi:calcium/calmodulin-dependent protein kinase I